MASREAEKEARRKARLEQEAKERAAHSRRKRLQMVLAGILVVGVVVAAVLVITGGGSDASNAEPDGASEASANGVTLPEQQIGDVDEAAEAAGCELTHPPDEGNGHEDREFTAEDYEQNPPTSGAHFPEWAQDGVYTADNLPPLGQLVHTLEHGRINVQYKPGTDAETVKKLEALVAEEPYHILLYENPTGMEAQVAATTWNQSLTCPSVTGRTWDALRTFRDRYIDTGPEQVP